MGTCPLIHLFFELFFDINIIFIIIFISVTEQTAASMERAFGQMAQSQHECLLIMSSRRPKYNNVCKNSVKDVLVSSGNTTPPHIFAHVRVQHAAVCPVVPLVPLLGCLPRTLNALGVSSSVCIYEVNRVIHSCMLETGARGIPTMPLYAGH